MTDEARHRAVFTAVAPLAIVTAVALVARTAMALAYFDVPGDGPQRAGMAYAWGGAPYLPTCGVWPPGHMFTAGAWSWLVPSPLWSARTLNVVVGTLTVPALFAVANATWGAGVGLAAAAALALFPLHIELSASGQTEPLFVFALLSGWALLLRAVAAPSARGRRLALAGAGASLVLAEMTRYEGWIFAAVLLAWGLRHLPRWPERGALAVLLATFPLAWTIGNARCGDALMGFRAALQEPTAAGGLGLAGAIGHLEMLATNEIGLVLFVLALVGIGSEIVASVRRRSSARRGLALALTASAWLYLARFTIERGASAWNRYAAAAFVIALSFACVPLERVSGRRRVGLVAAALAALSFGYPLLTGARVNRWVRSDPPHDAAALASWLAADAERARLPIVATPVGWELTYLALYDPTTYHRLWTVSDWMSDPKVTATIAHLRQRAAFLLVTRPGDEHDVARLERVAGQRLTTAPPVFTAGTLQVYRTQLSPHPPDPSAATEPEEK